MSKRPWEETEWIKDTFCHDREERTIGKWLLEVFIGELGEWEGAVSTKRHAWTYWTTSLKLSLVKQRCTKLARKLMRQATETAGGDS